MHQTPKVSKYLTQISGVLNQEMLNKKNMSSFRKGTQNAVATQLHEVIPLPAHLKKHLQQYMDNGSNDGAGHHR